MAKIHNIDVVNALYKGEAQRIHISQSHPLRNHYSHLNIPDREKVKNRTEARDKYREYLHKKLEEQNYDICMALDDIYQQALKGPVVLVCSCAPHPCHGDVIKDVIIELSQ